MRNVDFNSLPRAARERFLAAVRAPSYAFGGHGPIFSQASATGAYVGWAILLVSAAAGLLWFARMRYGLPWQPRQPVGYLIGYAVLFFLAALSIVGIVRRAILGRALPFTPGIYVFAVDFVVAHSKDLVIHPMTELLRMQPTHHYRNGIYSHTSFEFTFQGGAHYSLAVHGREIAERQLDALRHAQQRLFDALDRGDMYTLGGLDPFMEARVIDFRPVAEPGPVARALPSWTRFGWAIALAAGALLAVPTWFLRNWRSDEAAYDDVRRYSSIYTLEAYVRGGGRHADDVKKNLLPRAHLKKAKEETRAKRVAAIEQFLKDFPNSTVEAEARAALADAIHGEFLARQTVSELRDFLKKWPDAADAPAARAKIHALYQKSLADFRKRSNPNDKNVVPVVESLVAWMEQSSSPPLEVRFHRSNSPSLAAADKLLARGYLDDDGPAKGGNAAVTSHFTAAQAQPREAAVVRALEAGFRQVFPADILPLKLGKPLTDEEADVKPVDRRKAAVVPTASAKAEVAAPLIRVDYEVGWSGTTYIGRDSGRRFVGIAVRFDVSVRVPKEERVLSFVMKVEPPESFTVDYSTWDPSFSAIMGKGYAGGAAGAPSDARVYDVMALRAFDQLSSKLKAAFFDAATASARAAPPRAKKPAPTGRIPGSPFDDDDDRDPGDDL